MRRLHRVPIRNNSDNDNPSYKTEGAVCCDICSNEEIRLDPGEVTKVKTGLFIEIPSGYRFDIYVRSGLAAKGIMLANGVGKIDSDYRGEICVLLYNSSKFSYKIEKGDRIAQGEINDVIQVIWNNVDILSESERGSGGFGSTGI